VHVEGGGVHPDHPGVVPAVHAQLHAQLRQGAQLFGRGEPLARIGLRPPGPVAEQPRTDEQHRRDPALVQQRGGDPADRLVSVVDGDQVGAAWRRGAVERGQVLVEAQRAPPGALQVIELGAEHLLVQEQPFRVGARCRAEVVVHQDARSVAGQPATSGIVRA
jgi:hypothetical protein